MASNVDESPLLRRYLLGELSEAERAGVETRLLTDDGLFEELVLLEEDLIDEYAFGELPAGVRERLETHFAAAPERQEAIRLARLLRERSRVPESATITRTQPSWRTWGAAAAAALLVGTSVAAIFHYRQRAQGLEQALGQARSAVQGLRQQSAERESALRAENADLARRLDEQLAQGPRAARPAPTLSPTDASPVHHPPALAAALPLIASLALTPGTLRSEASIPALRLGAQEGRVRFFLALDEDVETGYEAELVGLAGDPIWRSPGLKAADGVVVIVDVPSPLFASGQHRIVLKGRRSGRPPETIASYLFRVTRG